MDPWHYDPATDLELGPLDRLTRFPREPDMLVYLLRGAASVATRIWLRTYHRFTIEGREHLPSTGSFVLVANHASHLDALCLLAALPLSRVHRSYPAAARDYFFVRPARAAFVAIFANAMPFDRTTSPRQSLALSRTLLETDGNCFIVFPEGGRSADGVIGAFRPGVGLVVAGSQAPVIPCLLEGTSRAWPRGCRLPRPRRVTLRIGAPRSYAEWPRSKESSTQIAEELRQAVLGLAPSGPRVTTAPGVSEHDR